MSDNLPFLKLEKTCDEAVDWITERARRVGLQVVRTFDLQDTWNPNIDCACPHHGTDRCDCEMAVLLIYKKEYEPISVVAHGYDGKTWFWIVNNPQQRADPHLETSLRYSLVEHISIL